MVSQAPCKGCSEREVGCHAKCVKYNEYKKDHEAESETIRKEKILRSQADGFHRDQVEKCMRKKGR